MRAQNAGLEECPVCSARGAPTRFERVRTLERSDVEILICRSCLVLLNADAYASLAGTPSAQGTALPDDAQDAESLREEVGKRTPLLNHLCALVDRDWSTQTFCDFGGGLGLVAHAATARFGLAVACELDTTNLKRVCELIGQPANLLIRSDLATVGSPVDVIFLWHVLEHLPFPLRFWESHMDRLSPDALFFVQVPLYRPDYVIPQHFTFFSQPSLLRLFEQLGVETIEVGFDLDYGFLTYVGRRRS